MAVFKPPKHHKQKHFVSCRVQTVSVIVTVTFRETMLSPESSLRMSYSSKKSMSPSISEPSLLLVLPSEPVDVVEEVEGLTR